MRQSSCLHVFGIPTGVSPHYVPARKARHPPPPHVACVALQFGICHLTVDGPHALTAWLAATAVFDLAIWFWVQTEAEASGSGSQGSRSSPGQELASPLKKKKGDASSRPEGAACCLHALLLSSVCLHQMKLNLPVSLELHHPALDCLPARQSLGGVLQVVNKLCRPTWFDHACLHQDATQVQSFCIPIWWLIASMHVHCANKQRCSYRAYAPTCFAAAAAAVMHQLAPLGIHHSMYALPNYCCSQQCWVQTQVVTQACNMLAATQIGLLLCVPSTLLYPKPCVTLNPVVVCTIIPFVLGVDMGDLTLSPGCCRCFCCANDGLV